MSRKKMTVAGVTEALGKLEELVKTYRAAMLAAIERPGETNALRAALMLPTRDDEAIVGLDQYQRAALRTWKPEDDAERRVFNAAFGLGGEVGEVLDLLKKKHFHGKQVYFEEVLAECGDVLYYLAVVLHEHGYTLSDAAQANVDKLRARHPEGFDPSYHDEQEM